MKNLVKQSFVPTGFSKNLALEFNNKSPLELMSLINQLTIATELACIAAGGDIETIKLHKLGRCEGVLDQFPSEAMVMQFMRPETDAEAEKRLNMEKIITAQTARNVKAAKRNKARIIAQPKLQLQEIQQLMSA